MSADGDFFRTARSLVTELSEAVESGEHGPDGLICLFQKATDELVEENQSRLRWLYGV